MKLKQAIEVINRKETCKTRIPKSRRFDHNNFYRFAKWFDNEYGLRPVIIKGRGL